MQQTAGHRFRDHFRPQPTGSDDRGIDHVGRDLQIAISADVHSARAGRIGEEPNTVVAHQHGDVVPPAVRDEEARRRLGIVSSLGTGTPQLPDEPPEDEDAVPYG